MKISLGESGGGRKPSICLVTGKVIFTKGAIFVLAVLVGFQDLDQCLVVNDICIKLVMTLWGVGGALNSTLCVSAFK